MGQPVFRLSVMFFDDMFFEELFFDIVIFGRETWAAVFMDRCHTFKALFLAF